MVGDMSFEFPGEDRDLWCDTALPNTKINIGDASAANLHNPQMLVDSPAICGICKCQPNLVRGPQSYAQQAWIPGNCPKVSATGEYAGSPESRSS